MLGFPIFGPVTSRRMKASAIGVSVPRHAFRSRRAAKLVPARRFRVARPCPLFESKERGAWVGVTCRSRSKSHAVFDDVPWTSHSDDARGAGRIGLDR